MINILTKSLSPKTTIPKVLNTAVTERLTGEFTLSFSTLIKEVNAAQVTVGSVAETDGVLFDIVSVTKEQAADGWRKIAVECEHVSYRLNDMAVETFTSIGTPSQIMPLILQGTGFSVGSLVSGSTETFSLQEATSKRGLVSAYARYIGAEVVYNNFTVSLVSHRGQSSSVQLKPIGRLRQSLLFSKGANTSVLPSQIGKR